jgi:hypothetical protein
MMGFLSVLGKIGGSLLGLGNVLGGQQEGAAKGQLTQAQVQQGQDRNAIDLYSRQQGAQQDAGQLDLQRKGFETNDRSATAKQALIGALLGGKMSPTSITGGKSSGGLLAALQANPDALGAMQRLGGSAGQAQIKPLQFTGGEMLKAPTMTPLPNTSKGSNLLSTIARIAQIGGGIASGLKKPDFMGPQ